VLFLFARYGKEQKCVFPHKSFDKLRIKKAENANVSGREKILVVIIVLRAEMSKIRSLRV